MISAFAFAILLQAPVVVDPYAYRPYQYSTPEYRQYEEQRAWTQYQMDRTSEIIQREKQEQWHEEEMQEMKKQREEYERD